MFATNSLSQNLTVLPAPSEREPLAQPGTLQFEWKVCRYAKGPIPEGAGITRSGMTGGVINSIAVPDKMLLTSAAFHVILVEKAINRERLKWDALFAICHMSSE